MLGLIDAALLANATSSSMNEFLKQVANAFRLEELKLQLTGLFAAHSINGEVFSVGIGWANFLKALLHDLSDRPVLFKDSVLEGKSGPGKNTYDAIVEDHAANPGVFDAFVVEATISYNDNGKVGRPAGFYWTIMFQQQGKRSGLNGHLYSIPSA